MEGQQPLLNMVFAETTVIGIITVLGGNLTRGRICNLDVLQAFICTTLGCKNTWYTGKQLCIFCKLTSMNNL